MSSTILSIGGGGHKSEYWRWRDKSRYRRWRSPPLLSAAADYLTPD